MPTIKIGGSYRGISGPRQSVVTSGAPSAQPGPVRSVTSPGQTPPTRVRIGRMVVGGVSRQITRPGNRSLPSSSGLTSTVPSTQPFVPNSPWSVPNLFPDIPQGLIYALQILNQLENDLAQAFDERMKALSHVGRAIATAANGLTTLAKKTSDDTIFNLPISYDDAPLEGATYRRGKRVFANESDSLVSAVLRIQWTVSLDPIKVMGLPLPSGFSDEVKMMVPGGFIYLLQNDSAGFIEQVPIVPKIEVGAGLELEAKESKIAPLTEIKAETEFESTFFWLKTARLGGFRTLAAIVNLFNQAMSSVSDNAVTLGLQSCEKNKVPLSPPDRIPVSPPR